MRLFFILMPEKSISVFHKTNAKNIMDLVGEFFAISVIIPHIVIMG